ncbi:MAG TPA: hypothetical protein VHY35_02050, partial [Stellaceae bacterium]|nr:hypothetical protein [Stellaceae bacterium]
MNTRDLAREMRAARCALTPERRAELVAYVPVEVIDDYPLIGLARIKVEAGLYHPAPDGKAAFVTPVLVDNVSTPE